MRKIVIVACSLLMLASPLFAADETFKIEVNKQIERTQPVFPGNYGVAVAESEPNNDCTAPDAAALFVGSIDAAIDAGGDEDWFVFQAGDGECVTFATETFDGTTTDTQLYIYEAATCTDLSADIAFDDDGGPSTFSLIEDFPVPAAGTYYLRVKHWSASGTGPYVLTSSIGTCPPPPVPPANNSCATAEPLDCPGTVSGTTLLATNDLEDLAEVCVPFGADGPDVFYEVCVAAGEQLTAVLTPTGASWDPALWFVTDCTDNSSCVAGVDTGFSGDPEVLSWTNTTGAEVCLFVIPDSFFITADGDFDLTVTCDGVVATENQSWGNVKARF